MNLGNFFSKEQMAEIRTLYKEGKLNFNSVKQEEWLEGILYRYNKFGLGTYANLQTQNFLTRVLSGHYSNLNEDMWY